MINTAQIPHNPAWVDARINSADGARGTSRGRIRPVFMPYNTLNRGGKSGSASYGTSDRTTETGLASDGARSTMATRGRQQNTERPRPSGWYDRPRDACEQIDGGPPLNRRRERTMVLLLLMITYFYLLFVLCNPYVYMCILKF